MKRTRVADCGVGCKPADRLPTGPAAGRRPFPECIFGVTVFACCLAAAVVLAGCSMGKAEPKIDPKDEAPPAPQVIRADDPNLVKVDHPEQFPVATAETYDAASELKATGVV